MRYQRLTIACFLPLLLLLTGCTTYSRAIRPVQNEVINGQPEDAVAYINNELGVSSDDEVPSDVDGESALLLLERATLLQGLAKYKEAARDMGIVDQKMEFLDIKAYDRNEIIKWLFSGSAYSYRAPAYERLMLNISNMINYLASHDLSGAKVEARRFLVIVKYFREETSEVLSRDLLSLGYYLVGFIFEKSRDLDEALHFYSLAYKNGFRGGELGQRIVDLIRVNRVSHPDWLDNNLYRRASNQSAMTVSEYEQKYSAFDLLVIVQTGLVPYTQAESLPLKKARSLASRTGATEFMSRDDLDSVDHELESDNPLNININLPLFVDDDVPYNPGFEITIDNNQIPPRHSVDITSQVEKTWNQNKAKIIAAAFSRAITRLLSGVTGGLVAMSQVGEAGLLAGMLIQKSMEAADVPDTRSWSMLPSTIFVYRGSLSPGTHQIDFSIRSGNEAENVSADRGEWRVINFSRFRQ